MNQIKDVKIVPMKDSNYILPFRMEFKENCVSKLWDLVQVHSSVTIIVYNVTRQVLVCVRQFRPSVYINKIPECDRKEINIEKYPRESGLILEWCAGIIDKVKSLEEIACDEIIEECGYRVKPEMLERVQSFRCSVGIAVSQRSVPKSPYLNFDPDYVAKPEFILPEGASKQRGRFELAFGQIGASVMLGALLGGSAGFYNGLRNTTLAGQTGKLRRTQLLNHITKQGAASANTLGSIALMYSSFGVIYSYIRGNDDEINTLAAATSTGLLFKSTSGLRKCAVGGGLGFGVATAYILITSRDRIQAMFSSYSPA